MDWGGWCPLQEEKEVRIVSFLVWVELCPASSHQSVIIIHPGWSSGFSSHLWKGLCPPQHHLKKGEQTVEALAVSGMEILVWWRWWRCWSLDVVSSCCHQCSEASPKNTSGPWVSVATSSCPLTGWFRSLNQNLSVSFSLFKQSHVFFLHWISPCGGWIEWASQHYWQL